MLFMKRYLQIRLRHSLTVIQVFSPTRFEGTRIALVSLRGPVDNPPLGPPRRSRIAAEFGYDTCVFLYDAPAVNQPRRLEIYVRAGNEGTGSQGKEVGGWGRTIGWVEVDFDAGGVSVRRRLMCKHGLVLQKVFDLR